MGQEEKSGCALRVIRSWCGGESKGDFGFQRGGISAFKILAQTGEPSPLLAISANLRSSLLKIDPSTVVPEP